MPEDITATQSALPLAGVRVADFSRVVAGPYCTMLLGDLGADVIKVEQPERGDDTRQWGPPYRAGESAYYLSLNRNKRSLTLDLKHADDFELATQLIRRSDVMIHNFRSGGAEALGLGYPDVKTLNPRLVYAQISGYGARGPEAHKPGYDLLAQALTGLMSITGPADGEPSKVGVAMVDVLAGLNAALGILVALYERQQTGTGRLVETSLFEAGLSSLINVASNYLVGGVMPKRYGNAHPNIVPYQQFWAADAPLVIAVGNDGQFARLVRVLGRPEWASDERFAHNADRVKHRDGLVGAIAAILVTRSREEWLEHLTTAAVPCAPVLNVADVLSHDQTAANTMIRRVPHPALGEVPLVANGLKLDGAATPVYRHPPLLGEHDAALRAWLNADEDAAHDLTDDT
ncbi:MAG: CoA transferase [Trueperaceae bacterium]|nr:CoA transferase [Trueperaceae bacterium]